MVLIAKNSILEKTKKAIWNTCVVLTGFFVVFHLCYMVVQIWDVVVPVPVVPKGVYRNERYTLDFDHGIGTKTSENKIGDVLLYDCSIPDSLSMFLIYDTETGNHELVEVAYDKKDNLVLTVKGYNAEKITLFPVQSESENSYDEFNCMWNRIGVASFTDSLHLMMPIESFYINLNEPYDSCEIIYNNGFVGYYDVRITNDLERIYVINNDDFTDIVVNQGTILRNDNNKISIVFDYSDVNGEKTCVFLKEGL
ncbi:MAG: hypothetical protein HUJ58_04510 [Erysipelotrichaceae bacterium]|nr:hypothetical protein [Erysipelotrichaceae bacterium]